MMMIMMISSDGGVGDGHYMMMIMVISGDGDQCEDDDDHDDGDCRYSRTIIENRSGDHDSCHAAVKKLFFYRFCMGRTSIVFRSKAIVWGVSLLCF